MQNKTIEQYLAGIKGFTSGFDYLRLILAISVLVWHCYPATMGDAKAHEISAGIVGNITYVILPMFFSLSGFLVASSLLRNTLFHFLWLRVVRLFPALTVEVVLSALILGPIATAFTLDKYVKDPLFYEYFLNVIGYIHFYLPGVFLDNPYERVVNVSLWTVPFELECYLALAALAIATLVRRPRVLCSIFVIAVLAKTGLNILHGAAENAPSHIGGRQLVSYFLAGVLIYLNRDLVPRSTILACACAVVGYWLLRQDAYVYLASLPIAYVTVWLGLLTPRKLPIIFTGDYSYGIYLYAGPIQQSVYHFTDIGKTYLGNVAISFLIVSLFAAFSWHAIEKPALRLKNLFKNSKKEGLNSATVTKVARG